MTTVIHAFDFLAEAPDTTTKKLGHALAAVGDDGFLKRLVLQRMREVLGSGDGITEFEGAKVPWRDVQDELSTLSLFGDGPRVVLIRDGDDFVSSHRSDLEAFVSKASDSGCLILDLKALASSTRLYKVLDQQGLIVECRAPRTKGGKGANADSNKIRAWIRDWAAAHHGFQLKRGADEELLQLIGPELGLLDQELAKLALFCETDGEVDIEQVRKIVGGWRTKTTWELLDAALDGHAADALGQLERLLQAGEAPQAIAGALLWSLRRFSDAAHIVLEAEATGRKVTLPIALEQAGFKKWPQGALQRAEKQLRQLGRHRAGALYQQLLELDLSMKGTHAAPHRGRWAIERMILMMSKQAAATSVA